MTIHFCFAMNGFEDKRLFSIVPSIPSVIIIINDRFIYKDEEWN